MLSSSVEARATHIPRSEIIGLATIALLASLLLFWGLADAYLWQDEAATAVLATRMLRFGRPLAYDGVNLVSIDHFAAEDEYTIGQRTTDPKTAVDYYIRRGDFKGDTTWKWQPWGQFVIAAISIKALGATTLAARLPFALAGFVTLLMLYLFVREYFGSVRMAMLSTLFLVGNSYWILHSRQCRYYALSSLFLVLTLLAYARWQSGGRWGAAAFILAAWCWFQMDFGTLWPVLLALFLDALTARRRSFRQIVETGLGLGAAIAPFFYYYEVWGRLSTPGADWNDRFQLNLFNMNEYVAPAMFVLAAMGVLVWRWKKLPLPERRLVAVACAIPVMLSLWIPMVAPVGFLRYSIMAAPLGSLLGAWLLVRGLAWLPPWAGWIAAVCMILTPWLSLPVRALLPKPDWQEDSYRNSAWLRSELSVLRRNVFSHRPDPNRILVEWFKRNAAPTDEILTNYEDVPLMFYLPNPIRGGLAAFRVEDDAKTPPTFVVLRYSVGFGHWPVFLRELARYDWVRVPLAAPDVLWGNNPDPWGQADDPRTAEPLYLARRVGAR